MAFLLQLLVFLAALAGIGLCSVGMLYFAGPTFSQARTPSQRRLSAAMMVLCLCGIVASATLGFVGVGAVMYYAQQ